VYASYLKRTLLIGNIVISGLVALSIIIVGVFELIPAMTEINQQTQLVFFKMILDYALFAFSLNLLREIAKDIEDIDGDYKAGMNTLPIAIGTDIHHVSSMLKLVMLLGMLSLLLYLFILG